MSEFNFLKFKAISGILIIGSCIAVLSFVIFMRNSGIQLLLIVPLVVGGIYLVKIPILKGKHWFVETVRGKHMLSLLPGWIGYTCKFCGRMSGLEHWQLLEMPENMAYCKKGKKMSLLEVAFSFDSVKCVD